MSKSIRALENTIIQQRQEIASLKQQLQEYSKEQTETYTLRSIIALLPGHIFWKNSAGVILGCNDRMAQMAGVPQLRILLEKPIMNCLGKIEPMN